MRRLICRTTNFYLDVFTERKVADIIQKIQYWNGDQTLYEKTEDGQPETRYHKVYSISLIPDYLEISIVNSHLFTIKTRQQNNLGYAICLNDGFVLDTYLKDQFKGNYRNLKKRHFRLEACFNIRYKMFYGDLSRDDYQFLMNCLRAMLIRRFSQKNDLNEAITEWDELEASTFEKVIRKEASIFVIYHNDIPIDISINYHFQKIMYGAVSSYDIDYYKFGLGFIEKIKLLEWCVARDYKILEFAYGDLDYKKTWSNCSYQFKYQVVYLNESVLALFIGKVELLRLDIKEYLKSKKIDVYYRKLKGVWAATHTKEMANTKNYEIERAYIPDINGLGDLREIGLDKEGTLPFKMAVNDFLYATQEHIDHTKMYKAPEAPNTFIIAGRRKIQKITFR